MKENLEFASLQDNAGGLLSPDDVRLFYYDIAFDGEKNNLFPYVWNAEVQSYVDREEIIVEEKEKKDIPQCFAENTIFMTVNDNEDKAMALFRHLRNAFSHYRINRNGDWLLAKDHPNGNANELTMIMKIDSKYFYNIISLLFKQKAQAEEEYNKLMNPEI
jgi:hypothetical protein